VEKMICVPLGSEFDIKCPTGQPRILISSHYDCPTFIRLSVVLRFMIPLSANPHSSEQGQVNVITKARSQGGGFGAS